LPVYIVRATPCTALRARPCRSRRHAPRARACPPGQSIGSFGSNVSGAGGWRHHRLTLKNSGTPPDQPSGGRRSMRRPLRQKIVHRRNSRRSHIDRRLIEAMTAQLPRGAIYFLSKASVRPLSGDHSPWTIGQLRPDYYQHSQGSPGDLVRLLTPAQQILLDPAAA
jgi:hypothetical protein